MDIIPTLWVVFGINSFPIRYLFLTQPININYWGLFMVLLFFTSTITIFIKTFKFISKLKSGKFKDECKKYFKKHLSELLEDSLIISIILSAMILNTYVVFLSYNWVVSIIYFMVNLFPSKEAIEYFLTF